MIWALAFSRLSFEEWVGRLDVYFDTSEWRYVSDEYFIAGVRGGFLLLLPGWMNAPDCFSIVAKARTQHMIVAEVRG